MFIKVRKYEEKDRARIREICKETASDKYKKSSNTLETIPIMFADYFMDYEPDSIFVAVDEEDRVIGYIECATDYKRFMRVNKKEIIPRIKRYDKKQVPFWYSCLFAVMPIKKKFVHLHMNLTKAYQRQGIGTRLMDSLICHLAERGINNLSVCCISNKSVGYSFYTKYGFKVFFRYGFGLVSLCIDTFQHLKK